jgi:nucleoside-diphosphate-sugar epimerase
MAVVDEDTPLKPDCIYPVTKWQCEILADYYYRHHGITSALMRYMWFERKYPYPYGWGLGLLARCVETDDAARANLAAGAAETIGCDVFHVGPETPITQKDIEQSVTDVSPVLEKHFPGSVKVLKEAGVDLTEPIWPVTRIEKAKRLLNWSPQYTFNEYLEDLKKKRVWPHPIDRVLPM